ncbi:hypothetical protein SAMN05216383_13314 [Prevotella sp. KH2C16]|nr:hypothetical protein SAMN05216383_13314 [Prevotella sp. KH2C16]
MTIQVHAVIMELSYRMIRDRRLIRVYIMGLARNR